MCWLRAQLWRIRWDPLELATCVVGGQGERLWKSGVGRNIRVVVSDQCDA